MAWKIATENPLGLGIIVVVRQTQTKGRKMYTFEAGKSYGNWTSSLKRTVVKRTKCYVTFNGGIKKRIRTKKIGDEETEYIPARFREFVVLAAAEY